MGKRTAKCKFKFPAVGTHCYNVSMTIAKVRTVSGLRARVKTWRQAGLKVGLVPTMGALHAGHLSLVAGVLKKTGRAVVSIFVNPDQFGGGEDFENYPRNEEDDCKMLEAAGAPLFYLPRSAAMYPAGPGPSARWARPEDGALVGFVYLPKSKVALLEPLGAGSPIGNFRERSPAGGVHHLCFEVDDIIAARDRLAAGGARVLGDGEPKLGAHGKPVIFLHPKDFCGPLIELEQA